MQGWNANRLWLLAAALGLAAIIGMIGMQETSPGRAAAAPLTAGGFTTNAGAAPASVSPGGTTTITTTVSSSTSRSALVDVELYSPAGAKVAQRVFDNEAFAAGQSRIFPVDWTAPSDAATGSYSVRVGIFSPGWGALDHWNNDAATVTVSSTAAATVTAAGTAPSGGSLPALPAGWPRTLGLGQFDAAGGAAAMRATAPFGARYAYLTGGANTGTGWATWNANGDFARYWIEDAVANAIMPAFIYYQLVQSSPGAGGGEGDANYANLQNRATMTAYFTDFKLLMQQAGAFPATRVVVAVEPDFWGFMQQRATGDNATTVAAQVAATGLPELAGLPNNLAGAARAFLALRDRYAPNVLLSYELSIWGTGTDIIYANPSDSMVRSLAARSAAFYRSLGATFDLTTTNPSDRDHGFKQAQYGMSAAQAQWDGADYRRFALYLREFVGGTGKRIVLWQIPLGNTRMRAQNNTWNHYQDNHVETWLDEPSRASLTELVNAGVIGLWFGRGADGVTCACDANGDGLTNPAPINGNTRESLSADDDGGFFRERARAYYTAGAMALP